MSDGPATDEAREIPPGSWSRYLNEVISRPGWTAARLAREAGLHRSTIYRWKNGDVRNVAVNSVRAIAKAVGDDPDVAMRAAAEALRHDEDDDYELRVIAEARISDGLKDELTRKVLIRRAREHAQRISDTEELVRLAERSREAR